MINIAEKYERADTQKIINKNYSMLIIGNAASNYAVNKIEYYESPKVVKELYGTCDLTDAFTLAKNIGAPHVFICNMKVKNDYLEMIKVLEYHDFTYIVPIDIFFSDYFFDTERNNSSITYSKYMLEKISLMTDSTIMMTDKHASLYENIDDYLEDMKKIIVDFKARLPSNLNNKNLCFVANNLADHKFSNVLLASALSASNADQYPRYNFGKTVFDIDNTDVKENELIYFKSHHDSETTVENLLNFNKKIEPEKLVMIDRIVKFIKRSLDLSHFHGKPMTVYQKLRIERVLIEKFDSFKDFIIRAYKINSIEMIKEDAGAGIIIVEADIWPINSTEKISVIMEE